MRKGSATKQKEGNTRGQRPGKVPIEAGSDGMEHHGSPEQGKKQGPAQPVFDGKGERNQEHKAGKLERSEVQGIEDRFEHSGASFYLKNLHQEMNENQCPAQNPEAHPKRRGVPAQRN